eukprot:gene2763-4171_t
MKEEKLKRTILKQASFSNVNLSPDGLEFLLDYLIQTEQDDADLIYEIIQNTIEKSGKKEKILSEDHLKNVIELNSSKKKQKEISPIRVTSFLGDETSKLSSYFGDAIDQPKMYINRYNRILDNCLKHEKFNKTNSNRINFSTIDSLLGSSGGSKYILGILSNRGVKKYFVEDLTGSIKLDLESCTFGDGMLIEGSFVICCGGIHGNKVFQVETMELPPLFETSKMNVEIDEMEVENQDEDSIVFISDVHLNHPIIFDKLTKLFDGYKEDPPLMFVFMGNFIDELFDISMKSSYISNFMSLASLIRQFPSIHKNSKFLFVPGPNDPGFNNILPALPISNYFVKGFLEKIPKAEFASNPCKIQFKSKEIIIFRANLLHKMRNRCIVDPNESMNTKEHMLLTMLSNGHLYPMDGAVSWKNDDIYLAIKSLPNAVRISFLETKVKFLKLKKKDAHY